MTDADLQQRKEDQRFNRTVLMLIGAGFLAVLLAGIVTAFIMVRNENQMGWVRHTYEVERQASATRLALEEMRSARRAQVIGLKLGPEASYDHAHKRLLDSIDHARALTLDNPVQQRNIAALKTQAQYLDGLLRASIRPGAMRTPENEEQRLRASRLVERSAGGVLAEERRLLQARTIDQQTTVRAFYTVLAVAALLLLAVGIGSLAVIRRYTAALTQSRNALQDLNANLESAVTIRTVDLQRANDEIQRFAYIVSHDLRSPLVNVMGFTAEVEASVRPMADLIGTLEREAPALVTEAARLAVREDLPEAVGFIRTSTQKMDRLINAILRLSREGRRTIAPDSIDLDLLVSGVIDAIRHRIDALDIDMRVAPDLPTIVSDRLAVEQILSNIIENATKYLQPGRPGLIEISGNVRHGRAIIEVADNGRGIDARDHERIFDLFRRSGEQDQPGEGIGLAHVRALAYRLGGTISVASELGHGATFTINLPVTFTGEKGGGQ